MKEGVDYNVAITFSVGSEVLSGLKYLHAVKRAGVTVGASLSFELSHISALIL